jgi:hypothetical protein
MGRMALAVLIMCVSQSYSKVPYWERGKQDNNGEERE